MLNQTNSVGGGSKEVAAVESEVTVARWDLGAGRGDKDYEGGEVRLGKRAGSSSIVVSPKKRDASSHDQDRAR